VKVDVLPPRWAIDELMGHARVARPKTEAPPEDEPPVVLRGDALERWYGRLIGHRNDNGSIARGLCLWDIACDLEHAGASRRIVRVSVAERDVTLGWDKFTERADQETRYDDIVTRVFEGRGPGPVRLKPKSEPPLPSKQYVFLTAASLEAMDDVELTWFIRKYVACGVITELDGKVKQAGKTTFIAAMVRAVLEGEAFLGEPTTYTPVVYLTEQTTMTFRQHLRRGGLSRRDDLHILLWSNTDGDPWPTVLDKTYVYMQQVGARLLIVDTLGQFSGVRGDEENKAGAAMKVMEPLQELAARGIAVLISRHDRKSGGETGDSGRGSSAYTGANDIILHLQRLYTADLRKKRQRELKTLTRLDEIGDLIIELGADEPYTYRLVGEEGEVRSRDLRVEMQAATPLDADDAIHRDELFSRVAGREIDKARVLKELIGEGLFRVVSKTPEGKQRPRDHFYQRVWADDDED
jgi:hypothetical protein